MRQQFVKSMNQLAEADNRICVMVGDIGAFGFRGFAEKFPGRFLNVGIREQSMVSFAAGLAIQGFKPAVHTITPFLIERAFEQIKVDFGYQKLGGCFVSVGSGFDYAALGCTHHSYSDIAMMRTIPGSHVFYPASPVELDAILKYCFSHSILSYIRIPARNSQAMIAKNLSWSLGDFYPIRHQENPDAILITSGGLVDTCVEALPYIHSGVNVSILHLPTLQPLNETKISQYLKSTHAHIFTIEDHSVRGGLADIIRDLILKNQIKTKSFQACGVESEFIRSYGNFQELCAHVGIDPKSIAEKINLLCINP